MDLLLTLPETEPGESPEEWFSRIGVGPVPSYGVPPSLGPGNLPYGWNMFELWCVSTVTGQPELNLLRGHAGVVDDGSQIFPAPKSGSAYAVAHWFGSCPDSYGSPANLYTTRYTWWQATGLEKPVVVILGPFARPESFSVQSAGTLNRWPTQMRAFWNGAMVGQWVAPFNAINQRKTFVLGAL